GMDENGVQTWTLYDGGTPIMDFTSTGSLATRYLNGPAGDLVDTVLVRELSNGTVAWYLSDHLGTVRDIVNNSGGIIDHVDYSAFGTTLDESSPSNGDRMTGFAGLQRDTVTGLNLAVFRVQNPATGRWTSQDPLSFAAGDANVFRYVSNRPADAMDRIGLVDWPALPGIHKGKNNLPEVEPFWDKIRKIPDSELKKDCPGSANLIRIMRQRLMARIADQGRGYGGGSWQRHQGIVKLEHKLLEEFIKRVDQFCNFPPGVTNLPPLPTGPGATTTTTTTSVPNPNPTAPPPPPGGYPPNPPKNTLPWIWSNPKNDWWQDTGVGVGIGVTVIGGWIFVGPAAGAGAGAAGTGTGAGSTTLVGAGTAIVF
ncbi:MAG: RHS repeat domain-containing protein, partial [Isosphaeraceae bacterium]